VLFADLYAKCVQLARTDTVSFQWIKKKRANKGKKIEYDHTADCVSDGIVAKHCALLDAYGKWPPSNPQNRLSIGELV
jgi:hypothetical protein